MQMGRKSNTGLRTFLRNDGFIVTDKKGNASMPLDAEDKVRYLMFKGALSEIPEDARAQIESTSERLLAIMSEDMDVGGPALTLAMFKALEKE